MQGLLLGAVAALAASLATQALAEEIDADTMKAVSVLAARGYAHPEAATVRAVHKSLATSGTGYCGEISVENSGDFTTFHVILEASTGQSVLRLSDFPNPDASPQADVVHQLMRNFGCLQ